MAKKPGTDKTRVLVVEDDAHLLSGIRDILELEEYAVFTAMNGIEGLRILHEHKDTPPHVIVSDIMMPYMDGFGFLDEVRKDDRWVQIPFIFLTAKDATTDKHKGRKMGADVYLTKPFEADDLLTAVSSRVERFGRIGRVHQEKTEQEVTSLKRNILNILDQELHQPLTLVENYAGMLKEFNLDVMREDGVLAFLRDVNSGADRLRRLIENFIVLVEIDSGDAAKTFGWRKREIRSLRELVQDAYGQIVLPDSRPREYHLNIPDDLPVFIADAQFLTIAIRELLDNAARFSAANSRVVLNARADGDWLEISVEDAGRGIPAAELENIWQPFYHLEYGTCEAGAGSGLAIVDGIAQIHGGTRAVVSQPGQGSVFTLCLPQKPVSVHSSEPAAGVATQTRILVVEDDVHLLSGIRDILELEGFSVLLATNGLEGLRVLNEHRDNPPDAIISDLMMPHMDGFGFLKEVRREDDWVTIPFIILTAKEGKPPQYESSKLGADVYLTKPFEAEDLVVAVDSSLNRQKNIQRVAEAEKVTQVMSLQRKILTILNHEFRTPLTLVVAYADMLKDYDPDNMSDEEVMTFLHGVNSGADRLRRLIENLITLVEIDNGDAARMFEQRKRQITSLNELVEDAYMQVAQPDVRPREFILNVAADLPPFVADASHLTLIIRELLDNAAKFSHDHGTVILNARRSGDWLEISVEDSGRGIPAEELENIWLPFYQIKREEFEDQGAGCGLAIVDGMVKIHGGTRSVISQEKSENHPGSSLFTVRLPLQPRGV